MYKTYVRPHLDYGDIIYHDQLKDSMALLETVQYQAALMVTLVVGRAQTGSKSTLT